MIKETIDLQQKLAVDKFYVDEGPAHIALKELSESDMDEFHKLELACPAGLYERDEEGKPHFDHAGCLECGTCRFLCGETILDRWDFPQGTFGVEYRYG